MQYSHFKFNEVFQMYTDSYVSTTTIKIQNIYITQSSPLHSVLSSPDPRQSLICSLTLNVFFSLKARLLIMINYPLGNLMQMHHSSLTLTKWKSKSFSINLSNHQNCTFEIHLYSFFAFSFHINPSHIVIYPLNVFTSIPFFCHCFSLEPHQLQSSLTKFRSSMISPKSYSISFYFLAQMTFAQFSPNIFIWCKRYIYILLTSGPFNKAFLL